MLETTTTIALYAAEVAVFLLLCTCCICTVCCCRNNIDTTIDKESAEKVGGVLFIILYDCVTVTSLDAVSSPNNLYDTIMCI